jgi:hypothetical protein
MPYKYEKRGTIPLARFIPDQIEVPNFLSVQEAENYLANIPVLLGRGELDSQTSLELSTLTKNWLERMPRSSTGGCDLPSRDKIQAASVAR